ncbi:ATP-binding protein [Patescibacteria group bacterium]|nr:ATP-binding protein [Patescibacteria group bacterium]
MSFYAASALVNFITSIIFCLLVFLRNPRNKVNYSFSLFAFGAAFWSLCYFFWQISQTTQEALFWSKALMAFAIFVPAFYSHFVFVFTGLTRIKKRLLVLAYLLLGSFLPFDILGNSFIREVKPLLDFKFWPIAGPIFPIFLIIWMGYVIFDTYLLYKTHKRATGIYKKQIKYVFWGLALAFLGGATNYFLWFEIPIPPVANILVSAYVTLTAIAIVRHRLLDIRLVFTRALAYLLIVSLTAALYIVIAFLTSTIFFGIQINQKQLLVYLFLTFILALSFPQIKKDIQRLTDSIFYKSDYDSQELLKEFSTIMSTTLELEPLSLRVLDKLNQAIKITRTAFVLLGKSQEKVEYIEYEGYAEKPVFEKTDVDPFLQDKRITVFDELEEGEVKETMRKLKASVVLRLSVRDQKIGVLLLGEKSSGDIYSKKDIDVLEIVAPQLSVAIQNAREYETIKSFSKTLKEEVNKATKELRDANNKLLELDKMKDEFLSIASHELRTPMTAIKSYVWLLLNDEKEKLTGEQKTHLEKTYDSVERLIKLVNDMLNVSRIQSGRIKVDPKLTDIEKISEDVISEMLPRASETKIKLSLKKEAKIANVVADPDKTKEILINLIGNSLKFTPKNGSITIGLSVKNGAALVKVSDTGAGLKKEDIPKLFQKFGIVGRNDFLTKQNVQGTGLGLYISKSIVELQGGKMWVESPGENKGSTFFFTLPLYKYKI